MIESLKERVAELEAKVEGAGAATQIEQRVSQIEENLQKQEEASQNDFRVYWRDSLRLETPDKKFQLRIGGRIHNDFYWYDQGMDTKILPGTSRAAGYMGDSQDGAQFRRARIYLSGTVYDNIEFKMQYDFAGGNANFRDVYMAMHGLPVGTLTVGQFKEPFSLEELVSSNNITFLERALPTATFAPSRSTGVMLNNSHFDDRITWAAGFFRHNTDAFGTSLDDDSGWNATARITGLPWYEEGGVSYSIWGLAIATRTPIARFGIGLVPNQVGRSAISIRGIRLRAVTFERTISTCGPSRPRDSTDPSRCRVNT